MCCGCPKESCIGDFSLRVEDDGTIAWDGCIGKVGSVCINLQLDVSAPKDDVVGVCVEE